MSTARIEVVPRLAGRYACVDLETTGADPQSGRIIEVGIVLIEEGAIVERWSSLVDPGRPISERIQEVTGITDEMVRSAPSFIQLLDDIRERCRDRVFAAHNARFDHGFLRAEFARAGRAFDAPVLCTVKLARRLAPGTRRHNLDAVIERYGLSCSARHRALPDAQAVADFLLAACAVHGASSVQDEVDRQLQPMTLPPQLPTELLEQLPEGAGAYRLFDAQGEVLYIGRAAHVRPAVLAQLRPARGAKAQLRERVAKVEWQRASGDWSAHLLELLWRQSTQPQERYTLQLRERAAAPLIRPLRYADLQSCYGEFRTEAIALRVLKQLAREHRLCLRVLGLEAGEGSCIAYQVDRCRGVCAGKESHIAHELRVQLAFADHAFRAWPFRGRVALTDARADGGPLHVFDEWRYIGTATDEAGMEALAHIRTPSDFDPRIYRLTLSALQQQRLRVRPLTDLALTAWR